MSTATRSLFRDADSIASPKRGAAERRGVHAWHPYYAGYSEDFVRTSIDYLGLTGGDILLDPWAGSGTTNWVAEQAGIPSLALDINPVMAQFAAAKSGAVLRKLGRLDHYLEQIRTALRDLDAMPSDADALSEMLSPSLAVGIKVLKQAIDSVKLAPLPHHVTLREVRPKNPKSPHVLRAFFTCALFITARKLSGYQRPSNPTWFKEASHRPEVTLELVWAEFEATCRKMADVLVSSGVPSAKEVRHLVLNMDARNIVFPPKSVDAVITSPPYLTRIDYVVSTRLELMILDLWGRARDMRRATMGAPVITNSVTKPKPEWADSCATLLEAVRSHHTKASATYYYKNMLQYFDDAFRTLRELKRVLRTGAHSLLVVQSSYYKDIEIPLSKIYIEMGRTLGFAGTVARREVVKGHMAHVNSRSSTYRKNKIYFEDVVDLVNLG